MTRLLSTYVFICSYLLPLIGWAQPAYPIPSELEKIALVQLFEAVDVADQQYRKYLSAGTLDDQLIQEMNAVYDSAGIEAYLQFKAELKLQLTASTKDSLWALQHANDYRNHLLLRGVLATYGWPGERILGDQHYQPLMLLLHPPKQWTPKEVLAWYSPRLKEEVTAGRMPAIQYAQFVDNVLGKMLRKPQLYGTNEQFDPSTGKVLPPGITDLQATNRARTEIGLPALVEGDYRLVEATSSN